jgi:hypothetical protein
MITSNPQSMGSQNTSTKLNKAKFKIKIHKDIDNETIKKKTNHNDMKIGDKRIKVEFSDS